MSTIPKTWPHAFSQYAAKSYDNFRVIPERQLTELQDGFRLLGQITFGGAQFRTVVIGRNIFVQGIPLDGTTHDMVEEFVSRADSEHQGKNLPVKNQEKLVYAVRDSIVNATENVYEGLTPDYLMARIALAQHSPMKVITSRSQLPEDAKFREQLGDIIPLSKKVEKAKSKTVPVHLKERFARSILLINSKTAEVHELPDKQPEVDRRAA